MPDERLHDLMLLGWTLRVEAAVRALEDLKASTELLPLPAAQEHLRPVLLGSVMEATRLTFALHAVPPAIAPPAPAPTRKESDLGEHEKPRTGL